MSVDALSGSAKPDSPSPQALNGGSPAPTSQAQPEPVDLDKEAAGEEQKPEEASKKDGRANERIRELVADKKELEIALATRDISLNRASAEIRRLEEKLRTSGLSEARKAAIEDRIEAKQDEIEDLKGEVAETIKQAGSARLELFREQVGEDLADQFCRLPRVSEELANFVVNSEHTEQLAQRLVSERGLARRLSEMHPVRMGAELAKLELELSREPPVRRVSRAPEPSGKLAGGSSPRPKSYMDSDVSMEEYAALRNAEIAATARR